MPRFDRKSPSVASAFEAFDQSLLLDPRETESARDRHRDLTAALVGSGPFLSSFLQGSFARKTMLAPLKDVDMVAVLPEVAPSARLSPTAAMAEARAAISAKFPDAAFDVEDVPAKALMVSFPDVDFHVDVVVAYPADGDVVAIGNRETGLWQESATKRLIRLIGERNQVCEGRFIHQVRMLKAIRGNSPVLCAIADGKGVSGLVMETVAYLSIVESEAHEVAIARALAVAATSTTGSLFDPAMESDLTAEWSSEDRSTVVGEFGRLARDAQTAVRLAQGGNVDEALRVWGDICGDGLPVPSLSSSDALGALYGGGGLTGTGRVSTAASSAVVSAVPTRAWRTGR